MITVDWIILAVIAIYLLIGLRRGFIMMLVHCVGGIASLLAASFAASYLAASVSQSVIAPMLKKSIAASMHASDAAAAWEEQSEYVRGLLTRSGVSEHSISSAEDPIDTLSGAIASAVGQAIAYIVVFLIVFVLCSIALHMLGSAVNLIAHLPVLHVCNALLGGLLGAAWGLLLCTCVLWACKLFVPAMYSDYGMLPPSEMNKSVIASTLVGWNDGVSLFDMIPVESQ